MVRRVFILFMVSLLFQPAFSQAKTETFPSQNLSDNQDYSPGNLKITQDERIDMLLLRYQKLKYKENSMPGYRIQIFFGSGRNSRESALDSKARFLSDFPGYPAYIIYETPYYKVRVGNFRTKREAADLFSKLKRKFPEAYITPLGIINLPSLPGD